MTKFSKYDYGLGDTVYQTTFHTISILSFFFSILPCKHLHIGFLMNNDTVYRAALRRHEIMAELAGLEEAYVERMNIKAAIHSLNALDLKIIRNGGIVGKMTTLNVDVPEKKMNRP